MCSDEQHAQKMAALARIEKNQRILIEGRTPQRQDYSISDTQGFHLDYKNRKHVFIYSDVPLVLQLTSHTYPVFQQIWTCLDFIEAGFKLFTVGTASPVRIKMCATDDMIG